MGKGEKEKRETKKKKAYAARVSLKGQLDKSHVQPTFKSALATQGSVHVPQHLPFSAGQHR